MTLHVHILILVHSKSQNLSNGLRSAILAVQTKKASKSRKIKLVVLPFNGPMNDISVAGSVQVIGCIELTNQLIVPWLAELHQWLKPHHLQVTDHLLKLQLRHLTKVVSVNVLHLNHWRLMLSEVAEVDQMMIEIKVKRVPKPILNPQILGLIIERLGTLTMNLRHLVTIVNH